MIWGLREWLLAGRDGRKPAGVKRVAFEGHVAFARVCSTTVRKRPHGEPVRAVIQAPAAGNMPRCKAMHPRWLV